MVFTISSLPSQQQQQNHESRLCSVAFTTLAAFFTFKRERISVRGEWKLFSMQIADWELHVRERERG